MASHPRSLACGERTLSRGTHPPPVLKHLQSINPSASIPLPCPLALSLSLLSPIFPQLPDAPPDARCSTSRPNPLIQTNAPPFILCFTVPVLLPPPHLASHPQRLETSQPNLPLRRTRRFPLSPPALDQPFLDDDSSFHHVVCLPLQNTNWNKIDDDEAGPSYSAALQAEALLPEYTHTTLTNSTHHGFAALLVCLPVAVLTRSRPSHSTSSGTHHHHPSF